MNKICLIKAGSAVVTREDGLLDLNTIQDIGKLISHIIEKGWKPILVSSGASSAGKGFLGTHFLPNETIKPITASIGQSNLIAYYINLLKIHSPSTQVAQLLINRRNLTNIQVYKFVRNNLLTMLSNDILPIINENDVLQENEINFSDNDHLASVIASMLDVNTIILFSDIDAIYTKNPKIYNDAKKIQFLEGNYKNWDISINDSNVSNGGMKSKLDVFKMMSILGINVHLLSKEILKDNNYILDILDLKNLDKNGTHLISGNKKFFSIYKRWLLSASVPKGIIIISKRGALALSNKNNIAHRTNLYCVGIENFFGKFNKGDIVSLRDENFNLIGFGKTSYSYDDLLKGKCKEKVFIHDNFFVSVNNDFFVNREKELIEQYINSLKIIGGYRVKENKPKIIIDNQRKGLSREEKDLEIIELNDKESSNLRFKAKKACKNIALNNLNDWVIFSIMLGKKGFNNEENTKNK